MKVYATAYQKFVHEAPRKLRLVADAIRGANVESTLTNLKFSSKNAAKTILVALTQAKSNAVSVYQLPSDKLVVHSIIVEEGPQIKRWRPVSRGMAHPYIKRTSHVKIVVAGELTDKKVKGQKG